MCGIVGAISKSNIVPALIEGLRCLEYRGYDSAGLAVVNGTLQRVRSTGRVAKVSELAEERGLRGSVGIAHTRWATHGVPLERNAHPHVSDGIAVVHNGIIENYEQVRRRLQALGYEFLSDTDSEVIAHLVRENVAGGAHLLEAVRQSLTELEGAYAIAVISDAEPDRLVVARQNAPLLIGLSPDGTFAASDSSALAHLTQRIIHLQDADCAELTHDGVRVIAQDGTLAHRAVHISGVTPQSVKLGPYRHYMQKEIYEQPMAVAHTLEPVRHGRFASPHIFGAGAGQTFAAIDQVIMLACGTSYHAGLVARHWIQGLAGIPCNVEIASEYRYSALIRNPRTLIVTISQSGETADTLGALRHARNTGHHHTLGICNVAESALSEESSLRFITRAGPEISVASTKSFTTQLVALALLAICLAKVRGKLSKHMERSLLHTLLNLPAALTRALRAEQQLAQWSHALANSEHAIFLGRGIHYPIAMEGALKLKELSYIHAEAYAAGELKHGPLALVDTDMPVIALAPNDSLTEKLASNLQEVKARGGNLYLIADQDTPPCGCAGDHIVMLGEHAGFLSPIVHTIPLQLLAYHAALARGHDIDKPRNLAKSVTVE